MCLPCVLDTLTKPNIAMKMAMNQPGPLAFILINAVMVDCSIIAAISREETDENLASHTRGSKSQYNGYNSEEYLDRLEPNGNIPTDKSSYSKRKLTDSFLFLCSDNQGDNDSNVPDLS